MTMLEHHGFRVFLHLSKMRSAMVERPASCEASEESLPSTWIPAISASLEAARKHHERQDWLGCETELFRLVAFGFSALEAHQRMVGLKPFYTGEHQGLDHSDPCPAVAGDAAPGKPRPAAPAEPHHPPGEAYRLARRSGSTIYRYVPRVELLINRMNQRAREEHGAPCIQWPHLDPQQRRELQGLLEGLLVAFLEREAILPNFTSPGKPGNPAAPEEAAASSNAIAGEL